MKMRLVLVAALAAAGLAGTLTNSTRWSDEEIEELSALTLSALDPIPADPSNRFAGDAAAAEFGRKLFFEPKLSSTGAVSCSSCHLPNRQFQDDIPLGRGVGTTARRTMPITGTAWDPFLFWDGRKDSQWAQALGPLESSVEHGGTRALYVHVIAERFGDEYVRIFGALPDLRGVPRNAGPAGDSVARAAWAGLSPAKRDSITRVFVNAGKAIAAYERTLELKRTRVDDYIDAMIQNGRAPAGVLSKDEEGGLKLFVGKARCTSCHTGARFTDESFHNTGVPARADLPEDLGRYTGARDVLRDEFNCRSKWSDAAPKDCGELDFVDTDTTMLRAYKTPSLRGAADRAPFMHAGQYETLEQVLEHYSTAPAAPRGRSELVAVKLSAKERAQLVAFLRALSTER